MKKSIQALKAYQVKDIECAIKLDANESNHGLFDDMPFFVSNFARYPDSNAAKLREAINLKVGVKNTDCLVGNGSSELLDLVVKTFTQEGDAIVSFFPSFSMYKQYAALYGTDFIEVALKEDFSFDIPAMNAVLKENTHVKVVFIASPNNPTGNSITKQELIAILKSTRAYVVVDEAYIEFSAQAGMIDLIEEYSHLIITRTFSKAFGLAALRIGYLIATQTVVDDLKKVQAPYSVNSISQTIALRAFTDQNKLTPAIATLIKTREDFSLWLNKEGFTVYESDANFLFIKASKELYQDSINAGILLREFVIDTQSYYRISIGTNEEMEALKAVIKEGNYA